MQAFDLIRDQQIILMSLGAALVPLTVAVLLTLVNGVRRLLANARERQQERQEQARQRAAETINTNETNVEARILERGDISEKPAQAREPEEHAAPPPVEAPAESQETEEEEESEQQEESEESAESSEMNQILSDVFTDDEELARLEALLLGLDDVDIQELAAFASEVAVAITAAN